MQYPRCLLVQEKEQGETQISARQRLFIQLWYFKFEEPAKHVRNVEKVIRNGSEPQET